VRICPKAQAAKTTTITKASRHKPATAESYCLRKPLAITNYKQLGNWISSQNVAGIK